MGNNKLNNNDIWQGVTNYLIGWLFGMISYPLYLQSPYKYYLILCPITLILVLSINIHFLNVKWKRAHNRN